MSTMVGDETRFVFVMTLVVADVILTVAATVTTAGLLLDKLTVTPQGAGPVRVTVQIEVAPPLAGLQMNPRSAGGVTDRVAVLLEEARCRRAEMVTEVGASTGCVVTVKVAVVLPVATVTLAGTEAAAELLDRETERISLETAGPLSVTVPVEGVPPVGPGGLSVTLLTAGPRTVSVTPGDDPPAGPEIVTDVELATGLVATVNVTVDAPAGIETFHGEGFPATAGLLLDRVTLAPPEGAGPLKVTLQSTESPPTTMVLSHANEVEPAALVTVSNTKARRPVRRRQSHACLFIIVSYENRAINAAQ